MTWMKCLLLAGITAACDCPAEPAESGPASEAPGTAAPAAMITLDDGSTLEATLLGAEQGVLRVVQDGRQRALPLERIERLVFPPRKPSGLDASRDTRDDPIRIALAKIELDSIQDAANRLNRIGADWEYTSPEAPLENLLRYDVVYFPKGWGKLDGLAALAETYSQYLEQGGGLLFAEPDVHGDQTRNPALGLLPYPVRLSAHTGMGTGASVVEYHAGKAHPLTQGIEASDLPWAYDGVEEHDARWTVLAKSTGSEPAPSLMVAEVGQGRVVLHMSPDDYGHRNYFKDPFVVRMVEWVAGLPDEEVRSGNKQLGPRQWPEFALELEEDFRRLIADEPDEVRAALEQAMGLLRGDVRHGSHWTAYSSAFELIHQSRSKAAIPLLLKLLADDRFYHGSYDDEIYRTFALFTGRPVLGQTPEEVARRWWFPQKDDMTVDVAEMSGVELTVVADELLGVVVKREPHGEGRRPPLSCSAVGASLEGGWRLYAGKYRQVLDERLLPVLLAATADPHRRWLLPGPLAAMYRLGRADELPRLVGDEQSPAARRVIAAAALHRAGESVPVDQLTGLMRTTSDVELKKAVVWLLGQSQDPAAVETVVGCLRHPHAALHEIAARAVACQRSPAAVEPLAEIVRQKWKAGEDASPFILALGGFKSRQAAQILADLMADRLRTDPENETLLRELVSAFGSASGKWFSHSGETHQEAARKALKWWHEQE